jgi:hypothetical protein
LRVAEGLKLQAVMAGIVAHQGFDPHRLGSYGKMHFQGNRLASSHTLNAAEANAAFGDAVSLRAQGGDLPLPYDANHKRHFGLKPGRDPAISRA